MADTETDKALIFDGFILFFTFLGAIWTTISFSSWIKKKLGPPEQTQKFSSKEALMLEEIYEDIQLYREKMNDLYKWHNKDDQNGVKLWYVPRSWGDKLDETIKLLNSIKTFDTVKTQVDDLYKCHDKFDEIIKNITSLRFFLETQ